MDKGLDRAAIIERIRTSDSPLELGRIIGALVADRERLELALEECEGRWAKTVTLVEGRLARSRARGLEVAT